MLPSVVTNASTNRFTVVLSPELESTWYSVTCPAMPGCVSQGGDREKALASIAEAMEGWLSVAEERGEAPLAETVDLVVEEIRFVFGWKAEEAWPLLIETAEVQLPGSAAAAEFCPDLDEALLPHDTSSYLTVPDHDELTPGTLYAIAKAMSMTVDEFLQALND